MVNSGTISDIDGVRDVSLVVLNPSGTQVLGGLIPVSADGKSSLAQQVNLT